MNKYLVLIISLIIALESCGPSSGNENGGPSEPVETQPDRPALPSIDARQGNFGVSSDDELTDPGSQNPAPMPTEPFIEPEATVSIVAPIAPGGVVDLGELEDETTENGEIGELIEQPKPGTPFILDRLIKLTIQDLANRLNFDPEQIQVTDLEAVEWTDSGLGCPAPGANFLTVTVPGYKITLASGRKSYIYHTDLGHQVVLCDGGRRVLP